MEENNNQSPTIWFFGDSWPSGEELKGDELSKAFPFGVGRLLDMRVENKAVSGSSLEGMIEAFLVSNIRANDIAIFCCTASTRRLYRTERGRIIEPQYQTDTTYVNPYEDSRVASHCCVLLYHLTKSRGAAPYFFNLFQSVRYVDPMYHEIPESNWLIPKTESVLSYLFDPEFFHTWDHHTNGDFLDWLKTESKLVKKYIRPSQAHPNVTGHETIANFIAEQLTIKVENDYKEKN